MTPSLKISQKVVDRLSENNLSQTGKLYGIFAKNNLLILGLQFDIEPSYGKSLVNLFPAEIYLCGVIQTGDGKYDDQSIKNSLSEVYVTDNPAFINFETKTNKINASFYLNGQLEKTKFLVITEQEILSQYLYLRLKADVPLKCELSPNSIKDGFFNLRKHIASGAISFNFQKSNVYLLGGDNETGVVGVSGNPNIGELFDDTNEPGEGNTRKKKVINYEVDVVGVSMLKKMIKENGTVEKEHAPLCVLDKKQCKTLNATITIDALSMIHRQTKISGLYEILVESAVRNLRLLENTVLENIEREISQPEVFHFYPEECSHFVTVVYLKSDSEDSLVSVRENLHQEFSLSQNRPNFRRGNRFLFKDKSQPMLINPHQGVKTTDNGGNISLVKGKYQYYHYCQDKMEDNGWGCAYRSLQTLASWFKLQGYTNKQVPSFNDIQKCLVDIGDKPGNFVGSKQWIGSTEVNYVLNTLLGVTSKILYVSSGEDMGSKGPELVNHFENHGSPIMIGGGVLAHTILGVDYNSQSGTLKFLILDPHYTGGEDLQIIQSKGWCGWKGVDFWDKTAYYNMCLPQVPQGI